ncbi:MAG: hypothetical protein WA116_00665 [Anaerolineaceae bacterium]
MPYNWETTLSEFTRQSPALAVLLVEGSESHAFSGSFSPTEFQSLVRLAQSQSEQPPNQTALFNTLPMGGQPLLVQTCFLAPGGKVLCAYPLETRLSAAKGYSQGLVEKLHTGQQSLAEETLSDLKPRTAPAAAEGTTWQDEFLALFADPASDQPVEILVNQSHPGSSERPLGLVPLNPKTDQGVDPPMQNLSHPRPYWYQVF